MAASNLDKFIKGARKLAGTIDSSGIINGTVDNFGLGSGSGLPTDTAVEITIDRVDSNGVKTPDKEEVVVGVVDGDRLVDVVRGVEGTAQAHSAGAVWEVRLTADQFERLVDGILAEHGQDGKHKDIHADSLVVTKPFPINAPAGFLINGKIVPSVDSSNLTVAIKTLSGDDPSATNPVYCRIGDTIRTITTALATTKNAGVNYCNSGGAELATEEVDYFVYLVWDAANSAVRVAISRICHARLMSDFSTSTDDPKYRMIEGASSATDSVELIGRFGAMLSAGAGYTWSVPTFTDKNLIQRPIFETRMCVSNPVITGFSSISTSPSGVYKLVGDVMTLYENGFSGNSNATTVTYTLPFEVLLNFPNLALVAVRDNNAHQTTPGHITAAGSGSNVLNFFKSWYQTAWTASNTKSCYPGAGISFYI